MRIIDGIEWHEFWPITDWIQPSTRTADPYAHIGAARREQEDRILEAVKTLEKAGYRVIPPNR